MLNSIRNRNKFRGPSSSEEFNSQVRDIREDIQSVYEILNENEKEIHEASDVIVNENFFLQRKVEKLENEMRELSQAVESGLNTPTLYANFYNSPEVILDNESPVFIDREYGVAMPTPTNTTNKLSHKTDTGHTVIPRDLEIIIEEEHAKNYRTKALKEKMNDIGMQSNDIFSSVNLVQDENFDRIVDKERDTYWTRKVVANDNLELFGRVVIRVPKEGVTNLFSNTLKINPYPEGSMTIHSINIKGLGNQWSLLENFPTEDGEAKAIKNAGKLMFNFPRREVTEIVINFSQPYYLENNDQKIFTYGFQGIDLEYRLFTEKNNSFITKIDLTHTRENITRINHPIVSASNLSSQYIEPLIEHKLYYDETLQTEFAFGADILAPIDKAFIKTTLKRDAENIPVIKDIRVPYTKREM